MDTIHNGHDSEWSRSQMDTILKGYDLEPTRYRMDSIPNEQLKELLKDAWLVRTFCKDAFNEKLIFLRYVS